MGPYEYVFWRFCLRVRVVCAIHIFQVALSFQNNIDEAVARSRELVSYWRDLGYARLEAVNMCRFAQAFRSFAAGIPARVCERVGACPA